MNNNDWSFSAFYQPREIFKLLEEGKLAETFIPKGDYDRHLLETVLPIVLTMPMFAEFSRSLKPAGGTAFRRGDDIPVITTGYQLSVDEVGAMRFDPNVFFKFMSSMGRALKDKALPIEEVFACIMDAVYTSDYILGNTMHTVH